MARSGQCFLDFGEVTNEYCIECGICYNKRNPKDIKIHDEIHGKTVPGRISLRNMLRLSAVLYNRGPVYAYGGREARAWCRVRVDGRLCRIENMWYRDDAAKKGLLESLERYFNHKVECNE